MARIFGRSRRFVGYLSLLLLAALVVAAAGCGGDSSREAAGGGEPAPIPEPSKAAPDFALNDLDGNPVTLSSTAGKVRIVDFWATWCPPCREEVPMYKELHAEYADKGVQIIAISMDDEENAELVRKFNREHGIEYLSLLGNEDTSADYEVMGLPATYVIDQQGTIVKSFVGPKPKKVLVGLIEGLLDDGGSES